MAFWIVSHKTDPFYNLALEDSLCELAAEKGEPIVYLWQNRLCCVIGVNQNPWLECSTKEMEKQGALLVRRRTGGGAVCHDLGNLNFSLCFPKYGCDITVGTDIILSALKSLGFSPEATGRNDICISGKKISGSAFRQTSGFALHHGTLLINSDLSLFPRFLTPDSQKLAAKGVRSVESRVANLCDFIPTVTADRIKDAILQKFTEKFGPLSPALDILPDISSAREFYASADFRFGRTPKFSENLSFRLPAFGINAGLTVEKGIVTDCRIWTDSLDTELPQKLEKAVLGKTYSPELLKSEAQKLA
ncbi:MAG: lipoate--protein ligase [Clostridia bacterium]|nr:lipoate--protein ligase [Clostridia bacterium]